MFYRLFRAAASLALRLFFRIETPVDPHGGLKLTGPVMYVGNHPNGLIDPGVLFVLSQRQVTFLAKEPLFRTPGIGAILRGLGALPVFRKQDGPGDTTKNEGTLTASVEALKQGRVITIFPEGKSHSEPQLAELKTGAARIALEAVRQGADVKIVPVGITYEAKNLFGSRVHVDVGAPISPSGEARELTTTIANALKSVTLNLAAWEELPLIQTAEEVYALAQNSRAGDTERLKAFARGVAVLRDEQPERLEELKARLVHFRSRLSLLSMTADDVNSRFQPATVAWFVLRNVLWLATLPIFLVGMVTFAIPYFLPLLAVRVAKPDVDTESTVKVLTAMLVAPLWWLLLTALSYWQGGAVSGLLTFALVPPLAIFTRLFFERRASALRDIRTFFVLGSRKSLQQKLVEEGREIAGEVEKLVGEYGARVA
ncbi:MAG: 1-acyl-sn-glycerol-3-phosphate acyltransferase [Archangium sp.]